MSWFAWKEEDNTNDEYINFILDTGTQINVMSRTEATNKGIKLDDHPNIKLNITRATGDTITNWKRLRVHLKSNETGIVHQEKIYISPEVRHNLISYETIKKTRTHTQKYSE